MPLLGLIRSLNRNLTSCPDLGDERNTPRVAIEVLIVHVNTERKFGTGTLIRLPLWSMSTLSGLKYIRFLLEKIEVKGEKMVGTSFSRFYQIKNRAYITSFSRFYQIKTRVYITSFSRFYQIKTRAYIT